jgi:predicted negative regulator of RcsB-dependent stress response
VKATADGVNWVSEHRAGLIRWIIAAVVIVVVAVAAIGVGCWRAAQAEQALNAALDVYTAPLLESGQQAVTGYYASNADRAKAANQKFADAARQFGWTSAGKKAHYFAGVTDIELGDSSSAERELKAAAGGWDSNLANLAKAALASLYHRNGNDSQAIDLLNAIIDKPSVTVSASAARLQLAEIKAAAGKQDEARLLWAKVKDDDKDGVAGTIAAQKLGGK